MAKPEHEITWRDLAVGCVVTEAGSASGYRTGDWRSQRPTYDFNKCLTCGICALFCPEPCIHQNQEGHFEADLFYCKGCGICARECPTGVITMVAEEEQ